MALLKCVDCAKEMSSSAKSCPHCGMPNKTLARNKAIAKAIPGIVGLVGFLYLAGLFIHDQKNAKEGAIPASVATSTEPLPPDLKPEAIRNLEIKRFNPYKGGFDNILMVNITLANKGKQDVKDIALICEHYSNSGTRIDSNRRVIYEIVTAGKSKTINDFNMGLIHSQAARTNCSITDLTIQ